MATKRRIEVFTGGCPVCEDTVREIKAAACPSCEVIVYDLNAGCETNECRDKAKSYGIKRVPAVVIDGRLADCCADRGVELDTLKAMGLGQPL